MGEPAAAGPCGRQPRYAPPATAPSAPSAPRLPPPRRSRGGAYTPTARSTRARASGSRARSGAGGAQAATVGGTRARDRRTAGRGRDRGLRADGTPRQPRIHQRRHGVPRDGARPLPASSSRRRTDDPNDPMPRVPRADGARGEGNNTANTEAVTAVTSAEQRHRATRAGLGELRAAELRRGAAVLPPCRPGRHDGPARAGLPRLLARAPRPGSRDALDQPPERAPGRLRACSRLGGAAGCRPACPACSPERGGAPAGSLPPATGQPYPR